MTEPVKPQRPKERIVAVVVSYSPEPKRFMRLLLATCPQVDAVLVADNAEGAGLESVVWSERIQRIDMHGNAGVAAAQNAGLRAAFESGASHVLLLDHDSVPEVDMVACLLRATEKLERDGERVASVGANYADSRRPGTSPFIRVAGCRLVRLPNDDEAAIVRPAYLISSGSLISAAAFETIGPMAEDLFIDYIDIEWGLRAGTLGWRSFGVCGARLDHLLGEEPLRVFRRNVPMHTPLRHYYIVRNAVWLIARRPLPGSWKLAEGLRMVARAATYALLSRHRVSHMAAMGRGLFDGLRGRLGRARFA